MKTIQYWGAGNVHEGAITGNSRLWYTGMSCPVTDAEATALIAYSASFRLDQVDDAKKDNLVTAETNPLTGGIELSAGGEVIELGASGVVFQQDVIAAFDGDSKSAEPSVALKWLVSKSPAYVQFGSDIGAGGSKTDSAGNGLTSTSRLAAMASLISTNTAAGFETDIYLTIGTNDIAANAAPETIAANIKAYYDAFVVAGGRHLVVMSIDPRSSGAAAIRSANVAIENYARTCDKMFYIDTGFAWVDQASASYDPVGGAGGGRLAVTRDGLHGAGYGSFQKQFAIEDTFNTIYAKKPVTITSKGDIWNVTTAPRSNVVGANGRFTAMGGTNSSTGGTVVGTPPLGFTLTGAIGGLTITFSAVNSTFVKSALKSTGDVPCVRMSIVGTPAASEYIMVSSGNLILNSSGVSEYEIQALAALIGDVTGMMAVSASASAITGASHIVGAINAASLASLLASDEVAYSGAGDRLLWLGCRTNGNVANPYQTVARYVFTVKGGVAINMTFDLIGFSLTRIAKY